VTLARVLVLAALLLSAAAVTATAQSNGSVESETRIQVFDPDAPLQPGETTSLLSAVTYRYGQGARADEPTEVQLSVLSTPGWAEAEFNTSSVTFPVPASSATSGRTDQRQVLLNVTVDDAPAFAEGQVEVLAEAEANGNVDASEGTDTQAVVPSYTAELDVDHRDRVPVPGGREHALPLHVTAVANAPTVVDVTLQAKPASSKVTVPDPTALEADGAGNASAFLDVTLRMPWTRNQEGTLSLAVTPFSANRTDVEGSQVAVEMTLVGQSLVPGPGAVAALLAAAAAARWRS
jgi:hypothetical protein